jgi:hypothetical protein
MTSQFYWQATSTLRSAPKQSFLPELLELPDS